MRPGSSPSYGREEGYLVTIFDRILRLGHILVDGGKHRSFATKYIGPGAIAGLEYFQDATDGGIVRELDLFR